MFRSSRLTKRRKLMVSINQRRNRRRQTILKRRCRTSARRKSFECFRNVNEPVLADGHVF